MSRPLAIAVVVLGLAAAVAVGQSRRAYVPENPGSPGAEFHFGRVAYATSARAGSRGIAQDIWAVDYPLAEEHFLPALERYTRAEVAPQSAILELSNPLIFEYPWLFIQQVAVGQWSPTQAEVDNLREYLARGGFLVFDDFHGEGEWQYFEYVIREILPGREIFDIPDDHPLMAILFDLDPEVQIPGDRHLWQGMEGPPHWRGVNDDKGRLMIAINHNIDMGDAWEHADLPDYPAEMSGMAYRFGTNYVIYAMTH